MGRLRVKRRAAGGEQRRPDGAGGRPRRRLSRLARVRAGLAGSWGMVGAGVGLWGGPAPALVASGVLLGAYLLLIADIAEPGPANGDGSGPW